MRKLNFIGLCIIAFIILPFKVYSGDDYSEEIILYLGQTQVISVDSPKRVAIANPEIADVGNIGKNELTIISKAVGTTSLTVWDIFGEQPYKIRVYAEDTSEIKRRIDNLLSQLNLPGVNTKAEDEEGKVVLSGFVKTAREKEMIDTVLAAVKDKVIDLVDIKEEEAVVEIDVQVLELNKDATNTLGFTWPSAINVMEIGSPGIQSTGTKFSTLFKVLNLARASGTTAAPFTFKLDALIQEGKARILSRPRLACQSGKEAELMVGGEKPIFTTQVAGTTGAEGTDVEYKEYGIKLKVKPTVLAEERIKLGVNIEVSEVGTAETIGTTGSSTSETTAKAYPLTKRSASTELFIHNGESMVIGGLIKQKSSEDIKRVPFLSSIPGLGLFFRQKTSTTGGGQGERGDSELFIILTPSIINQPKAEKAKIQTAVKPEARDAFVEEDHLLSPAEKYGKIIQQRILANLTYPASAKEAGFKGTVKLTLKLSYRGDLIESGVRQSSGYNILDENALKVARGLSPYPPFPSSIKEKELLVEVPITYKLD